MHVTKAINILAMIIMSMISIDSSESKCGVHHTLWAHDMSHNGRQQIQKSSTIAIYRFIL